MLLGELFSKVGYGTPLNIIADGAVGEEHMESATVCNFDITDPDFQLMFEECKDREVDTISIHNGHLQIIVKHPSFN